MLKVCNVLEHKKDVISAVTHIDGSVRLQTVEKELHLLYHDRKKSGVSVVFATNFNIRGKPVVESPKDAIRYFHSTGLDALVIGNYLLIKK